MAATTTGQASFGSAFTIAVSTTPAALPGAISIDPSGVEVNQVKIGALDDTSRAFAFRCGRITGGRIKVTYEYRKSNYGTLTALLGTDNLNYIYTLPDASTVKGTGQIASLSPPSSPEDDRITFDLEVQMNDGGTWTASA